MKKIIYKCFNCGVEGVKLWRQYQTFLNHIELLCVDCALKNQNKNEEITEEIIKRKDSIGCLVPAVPTIEEDTFWGYAAVPIDRCKWWFDLPLRTREDLLNGKIQLSRLDTRIT